MEDALQQPFVVDAPVLLGGETLHRRGAGGPLLQILGPDIPSMTQPHAAPEGVHHEEVVELHRPDRGNGLLQRLVEAHLPRLDQVLLGEVIGEDELVHLVGEVGWSTVDAPTLREMILMPD